MPDYRSFQRKNPDWPQRIRDVDGRYGRMRFTIENGAGDTFHEGLVVKIDSAWRGKLTLRRGRDRIAGVGPSAIQLLPEDFKPDEFAGLSCRVIKGEMGPRLLFEDENGETELIVYTPGKASKVEPPIVFDLVEEIRRRWNAPSSQNTEVGGTDAS